MKVYFSKILLIYWTVWASSSISEGERFFLDVELPLEENSKYLVSSVLSMEDMSISCMRLK